MSKRGPCYSWVRLGKQSQRDKINKYLLKVREIIEILYNLKVPKYSY